MKNPERLQTLILLRERAGLTLSDMAKSCGLTGRQSRLTAGYWEQGKMKPSRKRRNPFVGYLWDDLGLRNSHENFYEVWNIVVEEWEWEPLTARECKLWGLPDVEAIEDVQKLTVFQIKKLFKMIDELQSYDNLKLTLDINVQIIHE